MAKRVFYGVCGRGGKATVGEAEVFTVTIQEPVLTDLENFDFKVGDLLAVYFVEKQSEQDLYNPALKIQVTESNENITIGSDSGRFIKTFNQEAPEKLAWEAGEVVLFCYVENEAQAEPRDPAYWYMVNHVEATATNDVYGVTKLFDLNSEDIPSWYSGEFGTDNTTAVDPSFLRKVIKGLAEVTYESEYEQSQTTTLLGTLKNGLNVSYEVYMPNPDEVPVPTNTRQLSNQGPGSGNGIVNWTADGSFYITNVLNDHNLYFPTSGSGIVFNSSTPAGNKPFIVTDSNRRIVIDGADNPVILQSTGQYAASSKGNFIIDEGGLTVDKDGLIKGNLVVKKQASANVLKGNTIYENEISLKDKYAYKIAVLEVGSKSFTITLDSNKSARRELNLNSGLSAFSIPGPAKNWGWEPLGIVSWNWSYAGTTESDAAYVSTWEMFIKGRGKNKGILQYAIKNFGTRTIKVYLKAQILCGLNYYPSN